MNFIKKDVTNLEEEKKKLIQSGAIITKVTNHEIEYTFTKREDAIRHEEINNILNPNVPMYPPGYHY